MYHAKSVTKGVGLGFAILVLMHANTKRVAALQVLIELFAILFLMIIAYYFIEMHEASQRDDKK